MIDAYAAVEMIAAEADCFATDQSRQQKGRQICINLTVCRLRYIVADHVTILSFRVSEQGSMQHQQPRHPSDQHVICYLQFPAAM